MIRSTLRSRVLMRGVSRIGRRTVSTYTQTQDWEGIHGYTGDTKLPFTSWQPDPSTQTHSQSQSQTQAISQSQPQSTSTSPSSSPSAKEAKSTKTVQQQDEELKAKLEDISGEGGMSGVELEGGKAVGLKRGVKENMFRVI